jgi:hypothetical protein
MTPFWFMDYIFCVHTWWKQVEWLFYMDPIHEGSASLTLPPKGLPPPITITLGDRKDVNLRLL